MDDEDAFLYGDSGVEKTKNEQTTENYNDNDVDMNDVSNAYDENDKETESSSKNPQNESNSFSKGSNQNTGNEKLFSEIDENQTENVSFHSEIENNSENNEENDIENEDDSSSDSDIEFILDTKPGQKIEPPLRGNQLRINNSVKSTLENKRTLFSKQEEQTNETTNTTAGTAKGTLDLNAVGDIDGKPITEIDINSFHNKPWREPGADLTDYFNYGFDEFTWQLYCEKQDETREQYNPEIVNKMMEMMQFGMMPQMDQNAMPFPGMLGGPNMPPPHMQQQFIPPNNMPPNMPLSMQQNMGQNMPLNMPLSMQQNMPPNMPPNMPLSMQQNMGQNMPPNMPLSMQQNMPPNMMQNMGHNMNFNNMPPEMQQHQQQFMQQNGMHVMSSDIERISESQNKLGRGLNIKEKSHFNNESSREQNFKSKNEENMQSNSQLDEHLGIGNKVILSSAIAIVSFIGFTDTELNGYSD